MKQKWTSIFLSMCVYVCCSAQTAGYAFYSVLDTVKAAGFYKIALSPEINAHLKIDYSDIRIVNKEGKWVPHRLHTGDERSNDPVLLDQKFSIVENNKNNTVILIRPSTNSISNIGLAINNTTAKRYCTVSGSNDTASWFVINDSILLNPLADEAATSTQVSISFPPNNYKYLKVAIYNTNKDPFNIINVFQRTFSSAVIQDTPLQNPAPQFIQKDSGKISYLKISQQQAYQFDGISLEVSGTKYFNRTAEVYVADAANNSFSKPGAFLGSFVISNNSTMQFKVPLTKAAVFYLLINNKDNLPLLVESVKTSLRYTCITTYLEKSDGYKLIMGNPLATAPDYDASQLNKIIAGSAQLLPAGKIVAINEKIVVAKPAANYKWVLWVVITGVLFLLLLLTKKMMGEVDKTKQDDNL